MKIDLIKAIRAVNRPATSRGSHHEETLRYQADQYAALEKAFPEALIFPRLEEATAIKLFADIKPILPE